MPILPTPTPFDPHPRYPTTGWMFNTLAELGQPVGDIPDINNKAGRAELARRLVALGYNVTADSPPAKAAGEEIVGNGDGR